MQNVKLQRIFPFDIRDKISRGDVNKISRTDSYSYVDEKSTCYRQAVDEVINSVGAQDETSQRTVLARCAVGN